MKLKRVNTLLLAAIIVVNLYIAIAPLLPALTPQAPASKTRQQAIRQKTHASQPRFDKNTLLIPSLGFEQTINEGRDLRAATNSPWRLPYTSSPDRGSNTVIVGHRFTYTQPRGAFYHLDKLKRGDELSVYWDGKLYHYKVSEIQVVPANHTAIEAPSSNPRLTLYTCTPLWWPKDRLVVTAELEGVQS